MAHHKRCQSQLAFLASAVVVSLLFAATITNNRRYPSLLRNRDGDSVAAQENPRRRQLGALNLSQYNDPKRVDPRRERPLRNSNGDRSPQPAVEAANSDENSNPINHESRSRCQIVYVVGVEDATQDRFVTILEKLARNQADPESGRSAYVVDSQSRALKAGLFGWFYSRYIKKWGFQATPDVDDPDLVRRVVEHVCPDDGRKHVLIESTPFPSGQVDDRRTYRVHRQHGWIGMSPEEVANSDEALAHPTSMDAFYRGYSPLADVKFIVLHRPYLEIVASHPDWDGGPEAHSNILRGFMLILRRFLDGHPYDLEGSGRLWSLVCVERIMAKNHKSARDAASARANVLSHLADFLGWPNGECPECFDDWRESSKGPMNVLGGETVEILKDHIEWLNGVWPPPGKEGVEEQQCGI